MGNQKWLIVFVMVVVIIIIIKTGTYQLFVLIFSLATEGKNTVCCQMSTAAFNYSVLIFSPSFFFTCRRRKMKEQGKVDLNISHFITNLKKGGGKKRSFGGEAGGRVC